MINIDVISKPDFNLMERNVVDNFNKEIIKLTRLGAEHLRSIVPGSLNKTIGNDNTEVWTTSNKYRFIDEGTKPHRIEGLLVFEINGATIFSWGVDHPGTKPQHLTDDTVNYIKNEIHNIGQVLK